MPLDLRQYFTGHCKYAAILLALLLRSAGAAIYAVILLRRILAQAPRPLFRGPSWEDPVVTVHNKYAVILARCPLKRGRRRVDPLGPPGRPSNVFWPFCPPTQPSEKNTWTRGWRSSFRGPNFAMSRHTVNMQRFCAAAQNRLCICSDSRRRPMARGQPPDAAQ